MAKPDPALKSRIWSALLLAPLVLALVILSPWTFAALTALGAVLLTLEWRRLTAALFGAKSGDLAAGSAGVTALAVIMVAAAGQPHAALVVAILGALGASLIAYRIDTPPRWTGVGVLYLSLPLLALIWLRSLPGEGLKVTIWLLLVVWATDIAAYFVGRGVGGPRLAPHISPSKTWAGLCGGMIGAAIIGATVATMTGPFRLISAAGLAAGLAVLAQIGDLTESALKRRAGIKDSGGLIPGHGGLMDRVDGLFFAAPTFAVIVAMRAGAW